MPRPNDNGRFFEYLVTRELVEKFNLKLTERAEADQIRDKVKEVKTGVYDKMLSATVKIAEWLDGELTLDENAILDRLPDRNVTGFSHEDISIQDLTRKINFSLKWNHTAVFHGRIGACKTWPGIESISPLIQKYEDEKQKFFSDLHTLIPIGKRFANNGIYEQYREIWSDFVFKLHESAKEFLVSACNTPENTQYLFRTILGSGSDQYRVLVKDRKRRNVIIEDLRHIKLPKSLEIENIQRISSTDERSHYVWHLVFKFDNGLIVDGRNKQDSGTMAITPKMKMDWQVLDWGNSGVVETTLI